MDGEVLGLQVSQSVSQRAGVAGPGSTPDATALPCQAVQFPIPFSA